VGTSGRVYLTIAKGGWKISLFWLKATLYAILKKSIILTR
jgi:hypothetical protein